MQALTHFLAWLIGYDYDQCPICGRYVALLGDGTFVDFCSKRAHLIAGDGSTPETP